MTATVSAWKAVIAIPILFFLPGFAITTFCGSRRHAGIALGETVYLSLALSVIATTFTGLVMAELSWYSLTKLAAALLVLSIVLLALSFIRNGFSPGEWTREKRAWTVCIILLVVLAGGLFVRGFEQIIYREPGVYLAWAENVANRGSLRDFDEDIAKLSPEEFKMLFDAEKNDGVSLESNFYLKNAKTGEISFSYFPLYGVLIAIFLKLFGLKNTLIIMNPFIAVLGLLAVVYLVRRLLGKVTALVAGLLLAVNALAIYFSRYLTPEIFTLFALFLGLLCFAYFYETENGWWGAVAALCMSMTFTARFEMYYILVPVAVACSVIVADRLIKKKPGAFMLWFILPAAALTAHAIVSQVIFSRTYVSLQYRGTFASRVPGILAATLAVCTTIIVGALLHRRLGGRGSLPKAARIAAGAWRPVTAAVLALLSLFAYFIMPLMDRGMYAPEIPARLEDTFRMIFWYLTPVVFGLFLLGLALYVLFELKTEQVTFFLICLSSVALFTYSHFQKPQHIWVMRRYVGAVVPFILIIAAYALVKAPAALKFKPLYAASAAVLIAVIVLFARYSAKITPCVEYKGTLRGVQNMIDEYGGSTGAARAGPQPVLLFKDKPGSKYFPVLLRYVFNMEAYPWRTVNADPAVLGEALERWSSEGRRVHVLSTGALEPLWANCWPVYTGRFRIGFKHLPDVWDKKPEDQVYHCVDLSAYLLENQIPPDGYTVDVGGTQDSQFISGGISMPITMNVSSGRYLNGPAAVLLPNLLKHRKMEITLRMTATGQGSAPGTLLELTLGGKKRSAFVVSPGSFIDYGVNLRRAELSDPDEVALKLDLFPRHPGIVLDSIRVSGSD